MSGFRFLELTRMADLTEAMCGIVGLFLKDAKLEPQLGALVASMLGTMGDRGPDSAGFAVYGQRVAGCMKLTLRGAAETDFDAVVAGLVHLTDYPIRMLRHDSHAVILVPVGQERAVRDYLAEIGPDLAVISAGQRMELYKA